ncbi:MAG: hypothetical protein U9Q18_06005 [Caldisericota bacterium]|nr:hypothetical protein [Caldisericota bacterium]
MKEYILFDNIDIYTKIVETKPLDLLANILLLSYLSLAKKYNEILEYATYFSINSNIQSNILIENFHLLGYIGTGDIANSKIQVKLNFSIDPENAYTHLLNSLIGKKEGRDYLSEIKKAYLFLPDTEKNIFLSKLIFKKEELEKEKDLYIIPDNIYKKEGPLVKKIQDAIQQDPENPIFKTSIAETLYRADRIEEAEMYINLVLTQYPNYPRALFIAKEIAKLHAEEEKEIKYFEKILNVDFLSPYLDETAQASIAKDEQGKFIELKELFKSPDNPFISFFKKEIENIFPEKDEQIPQVIQTKKAEDNLKNSFDLLKEKKYAEALAGFLKELKKK